MREEADDIDLDQIVWDPRYRRKVIERLNRIAPEPAPLPVGRPEREHEPVG